MSVEAGVVGYAEVDEFVGEPQFLSPWDDGLLHDLGEPYEMPTG